MCGSCSVQCSDNLSNSAPQSAVNAGASAGSTPKEVLRREIMHGVVLLVKQVLAVAQVAEGADVVVTMLPNGAIVRNVYAGPDGDCPAQGACGQHDRCTG